MEGIQRRAAHLLIDAVSAFEPDMDEAANTRAVLTVIGDLERIGAIDVTPVPGAPDDGDLHVNVDISNLLTPAASLITFLVHRLAATTDTGKDGVIADLRAFVDDEADGD